MRRIGVMAVVLSLILVSLLAAGNTSLAQGDATPSGAASQELFTAEGVTAPISASTDVDDLAVSDPHLVLERITIPGGDDLATHTAASPELLLVEDGELSFEDDFGFSYTVATDEELSINADASYTLFNDSADAVSILRLSLVSPNRASGQGTPVSARGAGATPETASASEVLIDRAVEALPTGPATLFISQATFAPGSESGEQGHAGPLGLYVEDGVLSVQSPSGATGQLKASSAVVLPADTPLVASNTTDDDASALFVGIVESGPALVSEVTPEPTATLEATATAAPTAPLEPTATPEPVGETILYQADTSGGLEAFDAGAGWNLVNGMLVSDGSSTTSVLSPFDPDGLTDYAVEAEIQIVQTDDYREFSVFGRATEAGTLSLYSYSNPSETTQGLAIVVTSENFQLEDSIEGGVRAPGNVIASQELGDDGDWHTYRLEMDGNQIRGLVDGAIVLASQDNRLLEPGLAGLYVYEGSQINVRAFRVVALGDGTAASTDAASDSGRTGSSDSMAAADDDGPQITSIGNTDSVAMTAFLPSQDDVPSQLVMTDDRSRSLDEVVANYSDPAATANLFRSWGWLGNVVRSFAPPGGTLDDQTQVGGIYVSIHELGSSTAAAEALDYSLAVQAEGTALSEVAAPNVGDYGRALYGQVDYQGDGSYYQNEITYLIQSDDFLIRLSVASPDGDPTDMALQILDEMMAV